MQTLDELRTKIDHIDNAIIAKLAERFKVTNAVGEYKATHGLPAKDSAREAKQYQRITELALKHDPNSDIALNRIWCVFDLSFEYWKIVT